MEHKIVTPAIYREGVSHASTLIPLSMALAENAHPIVIFAISNRNVFSVLRITI